MTERKPQSITVPETHQLTRKEKLAAQVDGWFRYDKRIGPGFRMAWVGQEAGAPKNLFAATKEAVIEGTAAALAASTLKELDSELSTAEKKALKNRRSNIAVHRIDPTTGQSVFTEVANLREELLESPPELFGQKQDAAGKAIAKAAIIAELGYKKDTSDDRLMLTALLTQEAMRVGRIIERGENLEEQKVPDGRREQETFVPEPQKAPPVIHTQESIDTILAANTVLKVS